MQYILLFLLYALSILKPNTFNRQDKQKAPEKTIFKNEVFKEGIKTVLVHKKGWELSFPIIELNTDDQILLSFDEMGTIAGDYSWSIIHCNSNWEKSDIEPIEYLSGYETGDIDNFLYSQNTLVNYVNYLLEFPTEDSKITVSGNYVFKIYERNKPDEIILTRRFYVYEPLVEITASVDQLKVNTAGKLNQRLNIKVECGETEIENPFETICLKVSKNMGYEKNFVNIRPSAINGSTLKYFNIPELAFAGGHEFRHFDIKSIKFYSDRLKKINLQDKVYHVYLTPDEVRSLKGYDFKNDINGRKLIKLENNNRSNIMADYCYIHFELNADIPLQNGNFYIYGAISDWSFNENYKLNYDFNSGKFYAKLFLKQGYYNYLYYFKTSDKLFDTEADQYRIEGNHFQTDNEYHILAYYKGYSDSYDRLVSYFPVKSLKEGNY